jgi:hypothetical protein
MSASRVLARSAALAIVAGVGFAGVGTAVTAGAAPPPVRTLAVSTPPDATTIAPGRTGTIPVRIVNASTTAMVVSMTARGVTLGNDGQVKIAPGPDARWSGRVDFPTGRIKIAARSYVGVPVEVRMPSRIAADLYFVGFVVTPEARVERGLAVVNQIGSFFTIDVPGPRSRRLSAVLVAPSFVLGSRAHGSLRVRNVGHASTQFWGENDTRSSPGSAVPTQERIDKSLLPAGTARTYAVEGKPAWPIGFVTMKVHLVYPDRDGTATTELLATNRVLVVNPFGLAATLGVPMIAAVSWRVGRRRRAQGRRTKRRASGNIEDRLRHARSATGRARRG